MRLPVFILVAALVPSPAQAWGFAAHRFIMGRAVALLPPGLEPFFASRRDEVVLRSVDPDLWRTVGWNDAPNHFLDFGVSEYGAYPFAALPRDYGEALERFGAATLERNGRLPWRLAEMFGQLRRAFAGVGGAVGGRAASADDIVLLAAAAAHYLQDAHQPLHATDNFDGQQTGQRGVHARFETGLFERFGPRLTIRPAPPVPMTAPRDAAFDVLLESHRLAEPLLAADKAAMTGRQAYDDAYFEAFFSTAGPLLERRVNEAITATASLIAGAWEQAGRPALPPGAPRRIDPAPRR